MFGGETLYQLRAALQLAETEREGVSMIQIQLGGVDWVGSGGLLVGLKTEGGSVIKTKCENSV